MNKNRALAVLMGVLCFGLGITSCSKKSENNKIKVICSIFPEYDWTRQLLAGTQNVQLDLLIKNKVDLHSFSPSVQDIVNISDCDLFIYVGGESDNWIKDVLNKAAKGKVNSINLLEVLKNTVKEEEIVEGMQCEEEEDESSDEIEYDEHVWLSLVNAKEICKEIGSKLITLDKSEESIIQKNLDDYLLSLSLLDKKYSEQLNSIDNKCIICCDRFPFRYLMDDYNIKYYAAFVGCSAETEASFETIAFLTNKVDELNKEYIVTIENSDKKIANTVINNSRLKNQKIIELDSLQSIGNDELESKNYISVMENNLSSIVKAVK